ncbi:MAG: archaemetzincin family Zn-dependent metalloprotease [Candidatus Acidiferrales bacterium]
MKRIQLLALGETDRRHVSDLGKSLAVELGRDCEVLAPEVDLSWAFNMSRRQYSSTEILARMANHATSETWRLLGVTSVDLYIPVLTFVFGEAQLQGMSAIVSTYRLHQEFYGLPSDERLLDQRLLKEAVHELGHTLGLTHCENVECAMAASHAVEWIDLKSGHFCSKCAAAAVEQNCTHLNALGWARPRRCGISEEHSWKERK